MKSDLSSYEFVQNGKFVLLDSQRIKKQLKSGISDFYSKYSLLKTVHSMSLNVVFLRENIL